MDNDITSNKMSDSDSPVLNFKHEIESALQIFVKMRPSEKTEASILWNITSEKLQEIINNPVNAMNDVSFDVIKSNSMTIVNNNNNTECKSRTPVASSFDNGHNNYSKSDNSTMKDSEPFILSSKTSTKHNGNGRKKERTANAKNLKIKAKGKEIESRLRKFLKETENSQLISKSKTILHVNTNDKNKLLSSNKQSVLLTSDKPIEKQSTALSTKKVVVVGTDEGHCKINNSNYFIKSSNIVSMSDDESNSKNTTETINLESCREDPTHYNEETFCSSSPTHSRKSRTNNSTCNNNNRLIKKVQVVEKNRWSCKSCEKQFDDYLTLQCHISCEHAVVKTKQFQCTTCQVLFSTKSNLTVHLRRHVGGERPFICKMQNCSFRFTTSNNLRRHVLSRHQNLKAYRCSICDSSFSEKRSLQVHLLRHSGERPYSCSQCGKDFTQKKVLRNHMSTHSTERTFLCTQCGRSFKLKTHLRAHEIRHQGNRMHACSYCKASFFSKSDLNRHEQSHGEEKPIACKEPNCLKRFMRKQSLTEHINRHHRIKSD